tara:strand:+ start:45367 stop:45654 length:288 start_codon:yes stop_codon:yes gene_type:complete
MKIFNDPSQFVEFLEDNEVIRQVMPFGDELVNMHHNINVGCKCKKEQRISQRDHVYKIMLLNALKDDAPLQNTIKKYGGFSAAQFKVNDTIILEI